MLAGILNYVRYIGPAIVIGTLGVVGLLTYSTLSKAAVAPMLFLVIATVEGQFLTPVLMGHRFGAQPVCGLSRHCLLHLAVGATWRLSRGAAIDGADCGTRSRVGG